MQMARARISMSVHQFVAIYEESTLPNKTKTKLNSPTTSADVIPTKIQTNSNKTLTLMMSDSTR
jgi:hypothetical protein